MVGIQRSPEGNDTEYTRIYRIVLVGQRTFTTLINKKTTSGASKRVQMYFCVHTEVNWYINVCTNRYKAELFWLEKYKCAYSRY